MLTAALAALLLAVPGLVGSGAAAAEPVTGATPSAVSATPSAVAPSESAPSASAPSAVATAPPSSDAPAETTPPATTPPPTPEPPQLDPLPTRLVTSLPLRVSGSGSDGDTVDVSAGAASVAGARCQAPVSKGRWSCALADPPDGPNVIIRAESRTSGLAQTGRVDVLSPPSIASQSGAATGGGVRGTAYPRATVTVTAETGASCTFPADSTGQWGCVLTGRLPDGPHTVTATQVAGFSSERSAKSAPFRIVVDTVAPAAPRITSPAAGTRLTPGAPAAFSGTGEEGDAVTVYASTDSGTSVLCTVAVMGGAWSCSGSLPEGAYTVSALQRDRAGNVSAGSNGVALTVAAPSSPSATPSPSRTPSPTRTPAPTAPPNTAPAVPPAAPGPPAPSRPDTDGWVGTPFSTTSAPQVDAASVPVWLRSVALALAALILLVLPARLLAATIARGRGPREASGARPSLFGRNRPRAELGEADALFGVRTAPSDAVAGPDAPAGRHASGPAQPVWLAPVVGAAAAALITLSTSVRDVGAYTRLLLAVALAVAAINAVWLLSARGLSRHLGVRVPRVVVRPWMLVIVAAAAIGSRLLGLEPALLFGLVLGTLFADDLGRARRGRVAALQLSATAALGVLAWLLVGVLPEPTGSVSAFVVELANALALVGIGSTAIALLPLGGLAGRAVFQWSLPVWLGISVVVDTVLFAVLLPVASLVENGSGLAVAGIAALAFAVLSVSAWLWERYVEPAR
ncbi:Ig-like domain-containing protein [Leifsonia sp. F6_8S_P_1B]|uniref:Ig-like domain-containing protein n=1 Tax=Leifsonia williamsii TaxID=3035919 RepID=A0ABT8KEG0_9MICO|nr:Ig-like domain-containing protein [Leifsonia williamsii]MDN4615835.1 Ig-like domain-containing protein [Leifsonia williamsii]